jgi:hypothetical protein
MDAMREKITCTCGAVVQRNSYPTHLKSRKHTGKPIKPKAVVIHGNYVVSFN